MVNCKYISSVTFEGSAAVINSDNTFPEGASLKATYEADVAGTYTLSERGKRSSEGGE